MDTDISSFHPYIFFKKKTQIYLGKQVCSRLPWRRIELDNVLSPGQIRYNTCQIQKMIEFNTINFIDFYIKS
jgi:hypothetical protein